MTNATGRLNEIQARMRTLLAQMRERITLRQLARLRRDEAVQDERDRQAAAARAVRIETRARQERERDQNNARIHDSRSKAGFATGKQKRAGHYWHGGASGES